MTEQPYCIEGCGYPATRQRLVGITTDGNEIVELVCEDHCDGDYEWYEVLLKLAELRHRLDQP